MPVTRQQSRRLAENNPVETSSTLNVQGDGDGGNPMAPLRVTYVDSHLTPMEPIQEDTNPIVHEIEPGSVSRDTRGRRAEPLTNFTSNHQARLVYLYLTHRNDLLRPNSSHLRFAWREAYPDNPELHLNGPRLTQLGHDLSFSMPAPVVAYIRSLIDARLPYEDPHPDLYQPSLVFPYPTMSSLSVSDATSLFTTICNTFSEIIQIPVHERPRLRKLQAFSKELTVYSYDMCQIFPIGKLPPPQITL